MRFLICGFIFLSAGCLRQIRPPDCVTSCGMRARFAEGATPVACEELDRGEAIALSLLDGAKFNDDKSAVSSAQVCKEIKNWYLNIGYAPSSSAPHKFQTDCGMHSINLYTFSYEAITHELGHEANGCSACQDQGPLGLSAGPLDEHCPRWWANFKVAYEKARAVDLHKKLEDAPK